MGANDVTSGLVLLPWRSVLLTWGSALLSLGSSIVLLPSFPSGSLVHVVCVKHDKPRGQSAEFPDGQGLSQLKLASSKSTPHMNVSFLLHGVYL